MNTLRPRSLVRFACSIAALVMLPVGLWANETPTTSLRLENVTVAGDEQRPTVVLKVSGRPTYRTEVIDGPPRLVIDLEDTTYAWRKTPVTVTNPLVKQVRGSQYRKGVARVVIELTQASRHVVETRDTGLAIVFTGGPASAAAAPAPSVVPPVAPSAVPVQPVATRAPTPAPKVAPRPVAQASEPRPASFVGTNGKSVPDSFQLAQATTPAPAPAPPRPANAQRLISLDFKDADVVNLLRILAAESGRNIVIGEDVKGKMSISLRNVPWERALETILEAKGLTKVERDSVIRIVSDEQLAKERETRARVEEAKVKSEVDIRTKLAEAQLKEADATQKKLAAEAARQEAESRGPLKEETIRLSYADPEEVAKTLQGILGIPAEGTKQITGSGLISGPLIAEPPFSALYGQQISQPQLPAGPVSISKDVLDKGLTIRAYRPTNSIFLRLYAADLERIKVLIRESLDIPLPQVKIEARMEILDRNALEQIGVQWGGLGAVSTNNTSLVGQGYQTAQVAGQTIPFTPGRLEGSTIILDPTSVSGFNAANPNFSLVGVSDSKVGGLPVSFLTGLPLGGNLVNLPLSTLPNAGPLPAGGIAFGIIGTRLNINLALQALSEQGKTRTLARPEIVTVENNKATISLGEEIPYATISSAGTQIQFKDALLKLDVTPTVILEKDQNKIKLLVVVENNSRGTTVNLGSAGQPPAINKRKAETQVLIKEGDRLIIGGVAQGTNQNTVRKVPVLGDIPLLGHLFRVKENFETGRELVVFVTPTVLRPPATASAAPPPPTTAPKR